MSRKGKRKCWQSLLATVGALALILTAVSAQAEDLFVNGTYTVNRDIAYDLEFVGWSSSGVMNQSAFTNNAFFLAVGSGGSGTYNLSGGSLSVGTIETIGSGSVGTFNQSGGSNQTDVLILGAFPGSSGAYNLSGGSLSATLETIGAPGVGTFNQSGGSNQAYELDLGPGGRGTYNLSGGSLSATLETIGTGGVGIINQNGGTNQSAYIFVGDGSRGAYNLSGGSLAAIGQAIGYDRGSIGVFNQSGGSNQTDMLYLGWGPGSNGVYNLSGGNLAVNSQIIGLGGVGTFNQSGGTNTVNALTLAADAGSSGTYNLQGGSLGAGTINLNDGGLFNQTGGTLDFTTFNQTGGTGTFTDLYLGRNQGESSNYNLSGGSLSADSEIIGLNGLGTFNQSDGSNGADRIILGDSGGSGVYNLSGGSLIAGSVDINAGSIFSFTGGSFTSTNFNNAGIFYAAPGCTVNVGSNYTQTAAGNFLLGIASPASYGRISITGTASLNGALTPMLLGYRPLGGQVYSGVLTAAGGLNGTFTLANPWISPTLYWQQRYQANSVDLLVQRDYNNPGLGLNSNQAAVGAMLNGLAGAASGDLGGVLDAVDRLPASGEVQDAFKQISPDKAASLTTLGFAGAAFQMRNLATRTTNLRFRSENFGGSGGLGGFDLNYSGQDGVMLAYNGALAPGLLRAKKEFRVPESRWGLFVDGGAAFGTQKSTLNQTGYDFTLGGCTAGGDYRLADNLLVGLATGYSHTAAGFHGSGGTVTANTVPFNAYGAYFPGSLYVYGSLGYALNLFDLERGLNFGGLSRIAKSATTGHQFNLYGETGYDLKVWHYILTPAATLAYSRIWVNAFTEDDAGALNLRVGSQTADSLQPGLGGRLTLPFRAGPVKVAPQAYAFYEHEFANGSRGLNAGLSQGGSTFSFQTDAAQRNFAVVGGSLTLGLKENLWAQVNYNAEVGRGNYTAHFVNASLRYEF